ncbi:DUF5693 family protein [Paenibacillus sepulcri]
MSKIVKIITFALLAVTVLGSLPLLAERWKAEHNDRLLEIAVPGAWVLGAEGQADGPKAKRWKQAGATTVMLDTALLPGKQASPDGQLPEPYRAAAAALRQEGLQVAAYVRAEAVPEDEARIKELFRGLADAGIDRVQFAGMEIPGYPDKLGALAGSIVDNGLHSVLVKSQRGALELSRQSGYLSIRSLFFDMPKLASMTVREAADAFELGVRERGIRLITYMPESPGSLQDNGGEASGTYQDHAQSIIETLRAELGPEFAFGGAKPITDHMEAPGKLPRAIPVIGIGALFLLLGSCLFGALTRTLQRAVVFVVAAATLLLLAAWLFAPAPWDGRIESVIALWGAVSAPSAAVLWLRGRLRSFHCASAADRQPGERPQSPIVSAIASYIGALAITLAGIVYVTALLSDISYLAYVDLFRGVKLLYVGPIALISACLLVDGGWRGIWPKRTSTALKGGGSLKPRRLWLGGAAVLAAAVLLVFLLARTGNSDLVLPFEAELRQQLTDWFGIRPRTKEWLIGHPLLMAAACLLAYRNRGAIVLPVAAIGLCSMMNTFTHIHSPLAVSLTRSWTGALIGGILGLVVYIAMFSRSAQQHRSKKAALEGNKL